MVICPDVKRAQKCNAVAMASGGFGRLGPSCSALYQKEYACSAEADAKIGEDM
jgi:hypothetical protein